MCLSVCLSVCVCLSLSPSLFLSLSLILSLSHSSSHRLLATDRVYAAKADYDGVGASGGGAGGAGGPPQALPKNGNEAKSSKVALRSYFPETWLWQLHSLGFVSSSSYTMVENGKKHRQNSHLIIYFPTSKGVSEVSKRANE